MAHCPVGTKSSTAACRATAGSRASSAPPQISTVPAGASRCGTSTQPVAHRPRVGRVPGHRLTTQAHHPPRGKAPLMTTTPPTADLDALRNRQQQVWSSGDYNRIAAITVPVAETLVPPPASAGAASWTSPPAPATPRSPPPAKAPGSPASTTCRRCSTSPGRARPRSSSTSTHRARRRGPPVPDASFDMVLSAIGVMFAADHAGAAARAGPGDQARGRIALAS